MNRWHELFEDNKERLSSTSTAYLFTVAILGFSTIFMTIFKAFTEAIGMAGVLAGMTGVTKATAKWNDSSVEKASMNPDPVEKDPAPAVLMNVGPEAGKIPSKGGT